MNSCYCGNAKPFEACCEPFLEGQAKPATAEQLMRSRYAAYTLKRIDYIADTEQNPNPKAIEDWATRAEFRALRVIECQAGGPEDTTGVVVFEADYVMNGQAQTHRETSHFGRREGDWVFHQGKLNPMRVEPKAGRNDPCPCGSGKKYKKCCAS